MKPTLKQQNIPLKIVVYGLSLFYFLWLIGRLPENHLEVISSYDLKSIVTEGTVPFLCLSLLSLVLGGLLPHIYKERLIHLRWSNPLPGSRAFSKHATGDSRIDFQALEKKFGLPPKSPKEQNSHFFKIYKTCRDEVAVSGAHKPYLLFRDLCFDMLLLTFVAVVFAVILGAGLAKTILVLLSGLSLTVLLGLLANNYAHRFIGNVLANANLE